MDENERGKNRRSVEQREVLKLNHRYTDEGIRMGQKTKKRAMQLRVINTPYPGAICIRTVGSFLGPPAFAFAFHALSLSALSVLSHQPFIFCNLDVLWLKTPLWFLAIRCSFLDFVVLISVASEGLFFFFQKID
ncbi:hypothetical protein EDD21DRAFT_184253 [Dissophora ornata]|nr:hypothetical protein EDD21DRAFT_184253 [Dissophora ornata]